MKRISPEEIGGRILSILLDVWNHEYSPAMGLKEIQAQLESCETEHAEAIKQKEKECQGRVRGIIRDLEAIDRDAEDVRDFTKRVCDYIVELKQALKDKEVRK